MFEGRSTLYNLRLSTRYERDKRKFSGGAQGDKTGYEGEFAGTHSDMQATTRTMFKLVKNTWFQMKTSEKEGAME